MTAILVSVHGALGKMGREVVSAVTREPNLKLVGAADIKAATESIVLENSQKVPLFKDLKTLLQKTKPEVLVDFSIAEAALEAIRIASKAGINQVVGTTGFSDANQTEIRQLAKDHDVGIIMASNFALGAVVLMYLSRLAARYFDNAEIVELHHDEKADAPSGTALATARGMLQERGGKPFKYPQTQKDSLRCSRGGQMDGIAIHSVRVPGFVASQEVIFGLQGQTLKLRHDAINRECYMPGVILAIKVVSNHRGKVQTLEDLLQLGGKE